MFRGMPTTIRSISFSRTISFKRARKLANGSAGIYSSGCAIILSSSLTATPMRLVPWSRARVRMEKVESQRLLSQSIFPEVMPAVAVDFKQCFRPFTRVGQQRVPDKFVLGIQPVQIGGISAERLL